MRAQVDARRGESGARAGGRLLEQKRDVLAREVMMLDVLPLHLLEVLGEPDEVHQLVFGVVPRGEEAAPLEYGLGHVQLLSLVQRRSNERPGACRGDKPRSRFGLNMPEGMFTLPNRCPLHPRPDGRRARKRRLSRQVGHERIIRSAAERSSRRADKTTATRFVRSNKRPRAAGT